MHPARQLFGSATPEPATPTLRSAADENDYTTDTFQQITGHPPRPMAEFLHEHRAEFL